MLSGAQFQKQAGIPADQVCVRLQWDPDHDPEGGKCERRAIQLGLKGQVRGWRDLLKREISWLSKWAFYFSMIC